MEHHPPAPQLRRGRRPRGRRPPRRRRRQWRRQRGARGRPGPRPRWRRQVPEHRRHQLRAGEQPLVTVPEQLQQEPVRVPERLPPPQTLRVRVVAPVHDEEEAKVPNPEDRRGRSRAASMPRARTARRAAWEARRRRGSNRGRKDGAHEASSARSDPRPNPGRSARSRHSASPRRRRAGSGRAAVQPEEGEAEEEGPAAPARSRGPSPCPPLARAATVRSQPPPHKTNKICFLASLPGAAPRTDSTFPTARRSVSAPSEEVAAVAGGQSGRCPRGPCPPRRRGASSVATCSAFREPAGSEASALGRREAGSGGSERLGGNLKGRDRPRRAGRGGRISLKGRGADTPWRWGRTLRGVRTSFRWE